MVGPRRGQDASEVARGEACDSFPGHDLRARLGHEVVIGVAVFLGQVSLVARRVGLREALEEDVFEVAGRGIGVGVIGGGVDGAHFGGVVEDEGGAVAGAVDDEGDGEEVVGSDDGHFTWWVVVGCGWIGVEVGDGAVGAGAGVE